MNNTGNIRHPSHPIRIREALTETAGHIAHFIRSNVVLAIAAAAAIATSFIIPPDSEYLGYFDFRTLSCLFATLAVVKALSHVHFFSWLAAAIVRRTGNLRAAAASLVAITYFGSMLIANDMALLTFLPLGYMVMSRTRNDKYMAFTFILQNTAANLGGMLTPFGNPQNLYLYSRFAIPNGEFMSIMLPPFALATLLIGGCCLLFPRTALVLERESGESQPPLKRTILYFAVFSVSVLMVMRVIPFLIGLVIVAAVLLAADRRALAQVDYPLLFTFVCFFIFAGNMSRIPAIHALFTRLLSGSVLLVSTLSCQFISNVPSSILLAQFTENYRELLIGVNVGGVGTLISSLASLITFREYTKRHPEKTRSYFLLFTAVSFGFLAILTTFSWIWMNFIA